jgi:hypothetical protein
MSHRRIIRSAAVGMALAVLAAPSALAEQDLRSADTRDLAGAPQARAQQPQQDLRAPDTRDAAAGRGTFSAPEVTVVKITQPSPAIGGMDWGDAGIGAGSVLGLVLVAVGGTLVVVHRRQAGLTRRRAATTG